MLRKATWLATAFAAAIAALLLATPRAEAHHGFGRSGFGFGYPVFYRPPIYYAPRVAYIPPPIVYHYYGYGGYGYGYRYRRVVHHYYRRVAHPRWCSCR